ncbi:hypothetical protein V8C35DRAFT_163117 [Trichoderma chlorosporum]
MAFSFFSFPCHTVFPFSLVFEPVQSLVGLLFSFFFFSSPFHSVFLRISYKTCRFIQSIFPLINNPPSSATPPKKNVHRHFVEITFFISQIFVPGKGSQYVPPFVLFIAFSKVLNGRLLARKTTRVFLFSFLVNGGVMWMGLLDGMVRLFQIKVG